MSLVREFQADTSNPNSVVLNWKQPLSFNNTSDQIVVTRTITHFPMELYNSVFPTKATDPRGVEIFRGATIVGLNTGTISVLGSTLTDTGATFPTSPPLNGRLLRDSSSTVFRILSNTSTTITVESGTPVSGKYVILADFPSENRFQQNYEVDIRTQVGPGFISNLVVNSSGALSVVQFDQDELANLIFRDGAGTRFIVKSNTTNTVYLYESSSTPVIGPNMSIFTSFSGGSPLPYIDTFKTDSEAANRVGTGLLDNTFYYYTSFDIPSGANVAQAQFSTYKEINSTQSFALSTIDRSFGSLLYSLWPSLYRELDSTEDLQDLMTVFGFQFNEIHSLIDTYKLQDAQKASANVLPALADQTGLPSVDYVLGADTLRRIANDMISAWKLKGTKEGIFLFIKIITTWDITDGTGDISGSINDGLNNLNGFRFFSSSLGNFNTRFTQTSPFVAGGRFLKTLPGIIIPGFFTFREFVVNLPNVALFIGTSTAFSTASNQTTMTDSTANFGATDSLVGNFLLPNQSETNDIFEIIANTSTTITVSGILNNRNPGGNYAILSPLNTNRFIILNKLFPGYIPANTRAGFKFL